MPEAAPTCRHDDAGAAAAPAAGPLPDALGWIAGEIDALRAAGLERPQRVRSGRQGRTVALDGRTLLNFGSNDYLGYAGDVRLTKAASKASCAEGFGAGASPLVSGHSRAHETLERSITALLDVGAALVFPSGFAANAATLAAVAGPGDFIASDARNHASIIDGCRLSRAEIGIYPHRDMAALDRLLAGAAGRHGLIADPDLAAEEGAGGEDHGLGAVAAAEIGLDATNLAVLHLLFKDFDGGSVL
jgi:7-keto-8-aminopelargonate synthetase-like enzyme